MSIHDETEADTRAERIDPVLAAAGWGQNGSKIRPGEPVDHQGLPKEPKSQSFFLLDRIFQHFGPPKGGPIF